ncbi:Ger(x)C family spore germination protein [Tissierella pigra]|uniref:Ger(X)C family spore germination protein n=1 Tax=Tissierella pigra TaxID=2607614 RepID=A0A6N7XFU0_9FIRM|nr:Ger(x)C family spore germination protein [Tissierella pigra]MBU5425590.1 Ger(x)C family spore germination protein [Tissierella pigra]MSU00859.1 Ger(x)C family spore germination protein [Tissierella pigra]
MVIKKLILFKIIVIIPITFILTGCWDNKELDTISIVTGVGIDATEDEDKIEFILQIERVSQHNTSPLEGANTNDSSIILETEAKGILSAIEKLQKQVTRDLFMHHNQAVIFGKEQAEKGIKPYIDAFLRQQDMRMETLVFVAEGKAKDILHNSMEQDSAFSSGITRMVDATNRYSESYSVRVLDLVSMIIEETTAPTIPIVRLEEHEKELRLLLSGLAIFNDGGLIGQLNEIETRGYTWIMDKFKTTFIEIDIEEGFSNLNISNIKYNLEPEINNENKLIISLEIIGDIVISEIQGFDNMTVKAVTDTLLEEGKKVINREIQTCFNKSKELNADFLRFGEEFHKKFPKQWEEIKNNWNDMYQEVELSTKIELNLIDTGKIVNSLNMKEEN